MSSSAPSAPWYEGLEFLSDTDRTQLLGNRLYDMVSEVSDTLAPKITGMMLQLPTPEIVSIIETPALFREKLDEAMTILESEGWSDEHQQCLGPFTHHQAARARASPASSAPWYEGLESLSDEDRMQLLGNLLYRMVSQLSAALAPKITGMLLQLPTPEIVSIIETPALFEQKLDEAMKLLESLHWTAEQD